MKIITADKLLLPKFDVQRFSRERDSTDITYRGNRRWSGSYGRVWINSDLLFELSSFECKVVLDREDVFIGISKDSKVVSLTGEGTITIKKVFNRGFATYLENQKAGHDVRFSLVAALDDPDMIDEQEERIQIENVWFNESDIMHFEKAAVVETEIPFGFTAQDLSYIKTVEMTNI